MQSSPDMQGYALPEVIDPPGEICYTVRVPNDPAYLSAFIGALYDTTLWISWQRDSAHTGTLAAQRMRKMWDETVRNPHTCKEPPAPMLGGLLEDFELPLRVDCDCNVFVTCCDGTEKQILTADQVKALLQQQPGTGAPQPPPGGCATYNGTLQASGRFLLPTVVNSGDVITVLKADGLTNDGTEVIWRNFAGDEVFAGVNIGAPFFQSTDLLNTAFHDALLVKIGSTYYPAYTPFTVPGGVTNAQPVLLLNVTSAPAMAGNMDLSVEVCNNAPATFTHVFDFRLNSQGFALSPIPAGYTGAAGQYVPTVGWKEGLVSGPGGDYSRLLQIISPTIPPTAITGMSLQLTGSLGVVSSPPYGDALYIYNGGAVTVFRSDPTSPLPTSPYAATHAAITATAVAFDVNVGYRVGTGDPGGTVTALTLTVTGNGSDPF